MEKHAYLLVTDLHIDFSKANRIDYLGEILQAMQDILTIAASYASQGYTLYLVLLGDVFDGSLPNASDAMQATELLRYFCSNFAKTFAVVGNHEISYAKDNPFWFLVSEMLDMSLQGIRRFIQPRGMNNTIIIPDKVVDGDTCIYFNHYSTPAKVPEAVGVRIGVFHQNVGSNDICKMWGTFDDVEEAAYVQAYNYCFFGHMHLAKGKYYLDKEHTCLAEWLGTIGRTKVTEVLDNSLEVNIPVILVEGEKFVRIDDNAIKLKPSQECIDFTRLQATERSKQIAEEQRSIATNSYKGETLYKTLEGVFAGTPLAFLLDFLNHSEAEVMYSYRNTLEHPEGTDDGGDSDE